MASRTIHLDWWKSQVLDKYWHTVAFIFIRNRVVKDITSKKENNLRKKAASRVLHSKLTFRADPCLNLSCAQWFLYRPNTVRPPNWCRCPYRSHGRCTNVSVTMGHNIRNEKSNSLNTVIGDTCVEHDVGDLIQNFLVSPAQFSIILLKKIHYTKYRKKVASIPNQKKNK